jgi:hypothetical protein
VSDTTKFRLPPFTRRQFLTGALATGALTGIPAGLLAQGRGGAGKPAQARFEQRDYFFNFAHEAEHPSATYYLVAGGTRVRLKRAQDNPGVLKQHRKKNRFLRNVPDDQITHYVQNVRLSADFVTMSYVIQGASTSAGTWNMSAIYFLPPMGGIVDAAALSVERAGSSPLPLSAKRFLYGHPPARTAEDMIEEALLLDPSDHATAIIGMHPDMFSVEGTSGSLVHNHYIQPDGATAGLAVLIQVLGPATPQIGGQSNANGWATLVPIVDDSGQPFRNQKGKNKGLIQYHPDWNDPVRNVAQQGVTSVLPKIKQDATLGADVTAADPSIPGTPGALWKRHDGVTTIDQSPGVGSPQDPLRFTLSTQNIEGGFSTTGSAVDVGGTVQATLTFTNWYVRWLGIYLLFLDSGGVPVDPSGVEIQRPQDYESPAGDREQLDQFAAMFALMLGPEFTVLGIPVASSKATVGFNLPPNTTTVRVFASGPALLLLGGVDPNDPTTWGDWFPGAACTLILNYGVTTILMVAGVCEDLSLIQKAALIVAPAIAKSLTAVLSDELRNKDFSTPDVWRDVAVSIGKSLLQTLLNKRSAQLLALITSAVAEGVAEDCIPVVGQIVLGISLAAGAATLLETTLEIAASPVSYVYDLTLAHDIAVTIQHASNNDKFPTAATYYKVTAQFDRGATPHTQTLIMPLGPVTSLPPVAFQNVPFGGNVTVTVAFYSSDDRLLGKGTTGSVANDVSTLPDIVIQQYAVPIQANTTYEHRQVTVLTDAQGTHGWLATPTGPTVTANGLVCGQAAGDLCSLRDITVRQGSGTDAGFVGYAFQSFSPGVNACGGGGQGQSDQLVNMGDVDPASGYATLGCGLQSGSRITYSLFPGNSTAGGGPTPATSDFYLDTTNGVVRRVRLDLSPPQFDPPTSGDRAWGAFNLPSDDLLLHPSGRLVSINNALHKIEILRLPDGPVSDAVAMTKLLATTHAGFGVGSGARPGLLGGPVAAAVTPDGVIVVLEALNNRIQAFDVGANPVQLFRQQTSRYFLELTATAGADTEYLDLAVEYTGYLYVLSRSQSTNLYRLDIYHPGQGGTVPIATTLDMNAARLTVDFWRNVYTLNYDVLLLPGGGFPDTTEPSVSLWQPSTPPGFGT